MFSVVFAIVKMFYFHHLRSALVLLVLLYVCTTSGDATGKSTTARAGEAAKSSGDQADDESGDIVTGKISAFDRCILCVLFADMAMCVIYHPF